jgi:hypothetical protein
VGVGKVVDEGLSAVGCTNGRDEQRRDATTAGHAFEDDMAASCVHRWAVIAFHWVMRDEVQAGEWHGSIYAGTGVDW